MLWRMSLVLILVAAACGGADVADTNCEDPETAAERVRFASIVLLGTVTSWNGGRAEFQVEEIWRGADTTAVVEIVPEEGRSFTEGVRYLVFPGSTQERSIFTDVPCSATVRWDESLAELRPNLVRPPTAAPAQDRDLPWEWLIGAAVLLAVGMAGRRAVEGMRHPTPEWNPDYTLDDEEPGPT